MGKLISFLFLMFAACLSASSDVQEGYAPTKGGQLFCRTFGKGNPIVIIHGAPPLSQDYLLPSFAKLADENLVVFYDQRCCGHSISEVTEKEINAATFVEDIESVRKALNLAKITLLGHSWGGFLAMKYAYLHPDSVDKLILLNTMPASQEEFALFITEVTKRLAPFHDKLQRLESSEAYKAGDPQAVEKTLKTVFQTYLYNPDNINNLNFLLSPEGTLSGLKTFQLLCDDVFMKPYDIFKEIASIKCPTLILHGDSDPISYQTAEHIHKAIPRSKFIKIDQCGHFPFAEQPHVMFSAIRVFLSL